MEMKETALKAKLHNKFGALCLKSDKPQKALSHFLQAIESAAAEGLDFLNVHYNAGNAFAQMKKFADAIPFYLFVIDNFARVESAGPLDASLNNKQAYYDSLVNLCVMYLNTGDLAQARIYCERSIRENPENNLAHVNIGNVLRQMGNREEAIDFAWNAIEARMHSSNPSFTRPVAIQGNEVDSTDETLPINVVCVKWGKRYSATYVNILLAGVARHTTLPFNFYCLTDDPTDLDPSVKVLSLEEGWTGWWGKTCLFSEKLGLKGRNTYIDLDMIITANIDDMLSHKNVPRDGFVLFRTDDFFCEQSNRGGYNSSIIQWSNQKKFAQIYEVLRGSFEVVTKYVMRFDYWLEMNIKNALFVQDLYPEKTADYVSRCKESVPEKVAIVCFPRLPKPDDFPSEWIRDVWKL
eukprot:TRINITY_DN12774_c0_g1_i2.p1 TRINITY_DN12774_c0_g1~~TRINITY_DN12774_c0_g1_i2.p1  ORF type:complete len:408 (+),score=85.13 TRINITY_DN12774_c0_g1_i2:137-1360(+)